ncbi:hypothetical protein CY34DRAFT_97513, partial [Suillus luteus UH-Slu-Lm8-n1]
EPVNASIDLHMDEPWDILKVQILVKISAVINPRILCFNNYLLTYHISQVPPKPGLSLSTQADYNGLMKHVNRMAVKALNVNINVIQQVVEENKKQSKDELELTKSLQKQSQFFRMPQRAMTDHQTCRKMDSACPSTYCYLIPEMDEHFPLGHQQFDCWAAVMVDIVLSLSVVSMLTLIVINFTFGNEFGSFFKPIHAASTTPAPNSTSLLLPPSYKPGNDMSVTAFCAPYKLDNNIAAKFASNAFKEACLLRYVTFTELKEMEFKIGEISAL